jgi:hypothetical protein
MVSKPSRRLPKIPDRLSQIPRGEVAATTREFDSEEAVERAMRFAISP